MLSDIPLEADRTSENIWLLMLFSRSKYICLSPGEETEPATPILPEDTEKEDTTEILKESKGIYKTLPGEK